MNYWVSLANRVDLDSALNFKDSDHNFAFNAENMDKAKQVVIYQMTERGFYNADKTWYARIKLTVENDLNCNLHLKIIGLEPRLEKKLQRLFQYEQCQIIRLSDN